jgi:hypothetical protein
MLRQVLCVLVICRLGSAAVWSDDQIEWFAENRQLTRLPVLELPVQGARAVTTLGDGQLVVWAPGELSVWDPQATQRLYSIPTGDLTLTSLSVAPHQREIWGLSSAGDIHRWALPAEKRRWGPEQALGPPDTRIAGDQTTAWASAAPDDQPEWLLLEFAEPVIATEAVIYETFNPGALSKVSEWKAGQTRTIWEGADPFQVINGVGVATIPVKHAEPVQRLRLDFNSQSVPGWNEIDAVGLKTADGQVHWAVRAAASSTFAARSGESSLRPMTRASEPPPKFPLPTGTTVIKHDDGVADGKQSYGGTGFAVEFKYDATAQLLAGIELFGSRYGTSAPPAEDFSVTILDQDRTVIAVRKFPYAAIERGPERWYLLAFEPVKVPSKFLVAIDFHAHQTKGIYMEKDATNAAGSSYVGTVSQGFRATDPPCRWMVRSHLIP